MKTFKLMLLIMMLLTLTARVYKLDASNISPSGTDDRNNVVMHTKRISDINILWRAAYLAVEEASTLEAQKI